MAGHRIGLLFRKEEVGGPYSLEKEESLPYLSNSGARFLWTAISGPAGLCPKREREGGWKIETCRAGLLMTAARISTHTQEGYGRDLHLESLPHPL